MIDVSELRERLEYNPITGDLTWLPRKEKGGERKGEVQRWNTRFSGKKISVQTSNGYVAATINDKQIPAHRVAFALFYGRFPNGQIDHINGIKTDNSIANLREVDARQNSRNRKKISRNKTGVCGVGIGKHGKFTAYISADSERLHLGSFPTIAEAAAARANAERAIGYHPNHGRSA